MLRLVRLPSESASADAAAPHGVQSSRRTSLEPFGQRAMPANRLAGDGDLRLAPQSFQPASPALAGTVFLCFRCEAPSPAPVSSFDAVAAYITESCSDETAWRLAQVP